jgi:hypothetical protein
VVLFLHMHPLRRCLGGCRGLLAWTVHPAALLKLQGFCGVDIDLRHPHSSSRFLIDVVSLRRRSYVSLTCSNPCAELKFEYLSSSISFECYFSSLHSLKSLALCQLIFSPISMADFVPPGVSLLAHSLFLPSLLNANYLAAESASSKSA